MGADGATSQRRSDGKISYERAKQKIWLHITKDKCHIMGATAGNATIGQLIKYAIKKYFESHGNCALDEYGLTFAIRSWILKELKEVQLIPNPGDRALLAFAVSNGTQWFMLQLSGQTLTPTLIDIDQNYQSMGVGSNIIDPFFEFLKEIFWHNQLPTVSEAQIGVVWALRHTIATSSIGVSGPMSVGLMQKTGARLMAPEEITQELEQFIIAMQESLRERMQTRRQHEASPSDEIAY